MGSPITDKNDEKKTDSPTKQEKIVDEPTPNMVQYFTNVYRHDNNIL